MEKYFLIFEKRLVRGICPKNTHFLAQQAFEYKNGVWVEINRNEINDRLLSYELSECAEYGIGCTDIMDEIREISIKEKDAFIKSLRGRQKCEEDLLEDGAKDMFGFGKNDKTKDVRLTEKQIEELKKNMTKSELKEFNKRQKDAERDKFWDAMIMADLLDDQVKNVVLETTTYKGMSHIIIQLITYWELPQGVQAFANWRLGRLEEGFA